jgi:hypothetical protein
MKGDITPAKSSILGRFNPKDHDHKWFFLQTRSVFEAVNPGGDLFKQVEYAYYVCNHCADTAGGPNTIKHRVEIKDATT